MREQELGWTGARMSLVGQGTWNLERDDRDTAIAALQRGLDAGMTHVDTAEMYGAGAVEELIGHAIAGRRAEVFLTSKVVPANASFKGVLRACEASLRRLRTDHLDLYLLHWPGDRPLDGTIAAFEQLVRDGKIRFYGVSNFDEDELEQAVATAGAGRVACNQVLYHLGERTIEHGVIPACARHEIAIVGYSPFGSGRFPDPGSAGGRVLAEIAAAHEVTPHQVALGFLVRAPGVFTIPKAGRAEHAADNAAAGDLVLTEAEVRRIDAAFPLGRRRRGVPTL